MNPHYRRHVAALALSCLVTTSLGVASAFARRSRDAYTWRPPAPVISLAPQPASAPTTTAPPTTLPPAPVAAPPPAPTPTVPPTAPPTVPPRPLAGLLPAHVDAYRGLGTWVDVYDWSRTFGRVTPLVGVDDVDRMAQYGVQTLYIQTTKWDSPTDVLDPDLLVPIIERAHQRGIRVVAWYLPTLEDLAADLRRLLAAAQLGVQGLAVDIESRKVADDGERNRRLVALSAALRSALPGQALGAIVLPPVVTDVINPGYWPAFPWRALTPFYDVWLPMGYWTDRPAASGWRDGYRYTIENITRLRQNLGLAGAPVHIIGGIGDRSIPADLGGLVRGASEHGVLGGSVYDWRTTRAELWSFLQALRRP